MVHKITFITDEREYVTLRRDFKDFNEAMRYANDNGLNKHGIYIKEALPEPKPIPWVPFDDGYYDGDTK